MAILRSPVDAIQHHWEYYRERSFLRLVRLFVARVFRGGGDSDSEGIDLGIGLVLTLLAMPGGFVSLLLLDKYGTLLQWMRGTLNVDPLLMALPDEYFFIVLSMTVTGAVAVWRWDAIFPDRRDYMNLVPLPMSMRTIFLANLVAVLFLAVLIALDVNAASCVLFPMVVAATQTKFLFFARFAAVHALGVLLASVFAFLAVFTVLGLMMALLPPRAFKRISAYVRGLIVVYLVTLLCTSFAVPSLLRRLPKAPPLWTLLLPSTWFLALCQSLRDRAGPALAAMAARTFPGIAVLTALALCVYAVGYQRHFVRIAEMSDTGSDQHAVRRSRFSFYLDRLILRTPFQRGGFLFVWKTLFRSEAHRLVITGIGGLGLVLASQALMSAFEPAKSLREAAMSPDALSIPFILSFLIVVGIRVVFELPVELRSNWIFRLMLDAEKQECEPLARRVILILVLPWIFAVALPVYVYFEGWVVACLHALLVTAWSVLLTNVVLIRFRKLPFTCSLPLFKQHSIVILLACCFGFLCYAVSTPDFESWALLQPARMIDLVPVAVVAWFIPRRLGKSTTDVEKEMIFEELPTRTIEALQLGD
jgi:hypothetical protein